jgi:protein phosphatase
MSTSEKMVVIEDAPPVFAAADGVGGQAGGRIASHEAINALMAHFDVHDEEPADELIDAVNAANEAVMRRKQGNPSLQNMGTTVVACSVTEEAAYIANVGDSRAYIVGEGGEVDQITMDHSMAAELQRRGYQLGPNAPRNVITRALGKDANVDVDLFYVRWGPGEAVVLCSDGVWELVKEGTLGDLVTEHDAQAAAEAIVQEAKRIGPKDDMAVVVCKRVS